MITTQNMTTDNDFGRLAELAARWPVGLEIQHTTGWAGRVVCDEPGRVLGFGLGVEVHHTAHVLVGAMPHNTALCVERIQDGRPVTAWYRPAVLAPADKAVRAPKPRKLVPKASAPRERKRTRRAA